MFAMRQPEPYTCPVCGFTGDGPANYCEGCGARLRETDYRTGDRLPDNPQSRVPH